MTETIRVLHICNEVGLGGTERGIVSMCRVMRYGLFQHSVFCLMRAGARAEALSDVASVEVALEHPQSLVAFLASRNFQVVLIHRAGAAEPRWSEVLSACRRAGVPAVIEINIFGLVDLSPEDEIIDCHLHISKSSYCNFRAHALRHDYPRLERHRVLYIPVEMPRNECEGTENRIRADARRQWGFAPTDLVMLRTGRPDFRKWGDLLLHAIPEVISRIPHARFLLLSAPSTRAWYIRLRGFGDRVRVLPPTTDDQQLRKAYEAADIYVHSSRRGESFGVSLIEAMAFGLPVVVDSTPWRDNAQIEVVDHMKTGLIANSPASFARAVKFLSEAPDIRTVMGQRGREKALGMYDAEVVCASLARLIGATLRSKNFVVPDVRMLQGEIIPSMKDVQHYWDAERAEREAASWDDIAPSRFGTPFRRVAWFLIDAIEYLVRRTGVVK